MKNFLKNSDSTDLLLDAMCNVFGVVLLVAIIIGGVSISDKIITGNHVSIEAIQQAEKEYALLTSQLQAAQSQRQLLQDLLKGSPRSNENIKRDTHLAAAHQQLVIQVNTQADRIEALHQQINKEKALLHRLKDSTIKQEKALIEEIKKAVNLAPRKPIPMYAANRTDSLTPLRFIVDKEKFYPIGSNQDIYQGSTAQSAVDIYSFKQDGHRFFRIRKRQEKGLPLQDFPIHNLPLPPAGSAGYFVELLAESNAIAATAEIISRLRNNNIPFAWRIIANENTVLRTAMESNYEVSH